MKDRLGLAYQVSLQKHPKLGIEIFGLRNYRWNFSISSSNGIPFRRTVDEQRDENITWRNEQQHLEFCENYHRRFSYYSEIHLISNIVEIINMRMLNMKRQMKLTEK